MKQDLSGFTEVEVAIIKEFGKHSFELLGVDETCKKIEKKTKNKASWTKKMYFSMLKSGLFYHLFPDRIKKVHTPFATRLSVDNLERLNKLKKTTGLTIQGLINSMIESYYMQNKPD